MKLITNATHTTHTKKKATHTTNWLHWPRMLTMKCLRCINTFDRWVYEVNRSSLPERIWSSCFRKMKPSWTTIISHLSIIIFLFYFLLLVFVVWSVCVCVCVCVVCCFAHKKAKMERKVLRNSLSMPCQVKKKKQILAHSLSLSFLLPLFFLNADNFCPLCRFVCLMRFFIFFFDFFLKAAHQFLIYLGDLGKSNYKNRVWFSFLFLHIYIYICIPVYTGIYIIYTVY